MTNRFNAFYASILAAALVACTDASTQPAEAAPAATKPAATSTAKAPEPKVGDKIGETAADRAAAREAKAVQRAADAKKRDTELAARGVKRIGWEDLMPEGEEERLAQMYQAQMSMLYSGAGIAEGSAGDVATQIGTFNTVKELNGKKIRIPGYTVPFEYGADAQIKEFLLVPYFGACIHAPPPPPNQTVFVMADKPIKMKDLAQAVWIEGTIHTQTQESDLADAAYTIKLTAIEEYTY
ncbi:MAG: DUF3299 domain-containing protein [Hyphomonas sp.]|uniref:DUF3299 domain-containing protein n=1 Tax=Hyphomonas sp. TaxID=87 RepID=UPI00349FD506